ncbi:MAG: CRISPR-associated helicase Cas3', partial [Gammaproteobacteria bacterium]|nr:CRISPR-associated helicase Cas3' [Gammaproteobacteria bacterium]
DDAREAYEQLQQRLPEGMVDLFHARYAMADRLAIEQRVLHHFGATSTPELRRGRVLVATQVVEQSLDLDFDLMVTDLAPIDLIIQRAGRLCRHARDESGARLQGRDQRGKPLLLIHGPDPAGDIDGGWYKDFFKRAAGVYPNHGQLWLTAKLLLDGGKFQMPADARILIEGVYGEEVEYPGVLQESVWSAEGDNAAKRGLAALNALDLSAGYGGGFENGWWEEANTPTRLGEETTTVYLARWDGEQLSPWVSKSDFPWPNSAVQIRKALIASESNTQVPEAVLEQVRQKLPAKGKWGVLLVMEEGASSEWFGSVMDERKRDRLVRYSLASGLIVDS